MASCAYAAFFSRAIGLSPALAPEPASRGASPQDWVERLNAASAGSFDEFELGEADTEALAEALFAETERVAESVIDSLIRPGESAAELWIPQNKPAGFWLRGAPRKSRGSSPAPRARFPSQWLAPL